MLLWGGIRHLGKPLVVRMASYVFVGYYKLKERLGNETGRFSILTSVTREMWVFTRPH